jgi:serine/threonine protein kinase
MAENSSRSSPSAPTLAPVAVRALVAAARQRRLLNDAASARLWKAAVAAGVADPDSIRQWLAETTSAGVDAAALTALLPAPGAMPFGAYPPLAHLADGGMGAVWLTCLTDGVTLAVLKVLPSGEAPDFDRLRRRFAREVTVTRNLHHPNILRCLDGGTSENGPFLVLEYVPSGNLEELVVARGPLPEGVALTLAYQIADGLSEAHRQHLVHRDVKPANLFVTADGTAKIADFGIARLETGDGAGLTVAGTVLGSPFYMSPEQVRGEKVGPAADIYSLGCVLFFSLVGQPPFPGRPHEVMRAHEISPPPDLASRGVKVCKATSAVLARCLAKRPEQRFANMLELLTQLAEAREAAGGPDPAAWFGVEVIDAPGREPVPIRFREPEELLAMAEARYQPQTNSMRIEKEKEKEEKIKEEKIKEKDKSSPEPEEPDEPKIVRPRTETIRLSPWLALCSDVSGQGLALHLFGKREVVLGKLAKKPVDITVLLYPIGTHRAENQQISRSHCSLRFNDETWEVKDLGSNNGTILNGRPLVSQKPMVLPVGQRHRLDLGGVLKVELTPLPVRTDVGQMPTGTASTESDALVVKRIGNRPELIYAVVLRYLRIGGEGADVVLPGSRAGSGCEVSLSASGWHWRHWTQGTPSGAWQNLSATAFLECAGTVLRGVTGDHQLYISQ